MTKLATNLTAVVRYTEAQTAKVRSATEIKIMLGPVVVASKTLGGRYSQTQALTEFRRNSKSFTLTNGVNLGEVMRLAG